ncbi:MAG: MAPEG family protein [Hyphomicrobiaceae bacterium]
MQPTVILYPVLVQVALTLGLLIVLNRARGASMRAHDQKLTDADVELGQNTWSPAATKAGRSYLSQFELPVLFYAASAFAMITSAVNVFMLVCAWIFAISRIVHATIHVGPNVIAWRAPAFIVGLLAVLAMWVMLAIHIL